MCIYNNVVFPYMLGKKDNEIILSIHKKHIFMLSFLQNLQYLHLFGTDITFADLENVLTTDRQLDKLIDDSSRTFILIA